MNWLDRIFKEATAAIGSEYFHLPVCERGEIYRERVYCYELYHQVRTRWPSPEACSYRLNGELDKVAHPLMQSCAAGRSKPDFLVHAPGTMNQNYAIFEIKAQNARRSAIKKDIETLNQFRRTAHYGRAIYLVYGDGAEKSLPTICEVAKQITNLDKIEVWLHDKVGQPALTAYSTL
ncbi:MAG: methionyl-tRNA formyltransferase-like protein [Phycisphaerales bacterium]|nr:methionyl-tRNA formyltransferase-like protein [Phycisphaerales bacterium]